MADSDMEFELDENAFGLGTTEATSFFRDPAIDGEHAKLNVRNDKSLESDVLTIIENNSEVKIEDNSDPDWVKVNTGETTGYVKRDYVEVSEDGQNATVRTPELAFKDYKKSNWEHSLTNLKDKALKGEISEDEYYKLLDGLKDTPDGPSDELIDQARRSYDEYKELGEFTVGDPVSAVDNEVSGIENMEPKSELLDFNDDFNAYKKAEDEEGSNYLDDEELDLDEGENITTKVSVGSKQSKKDALNMLMDDKKAGGKVENNSAAIASAIGGVASGLGAAISGAVANVKNHLDSLGASLSTTTNLRDRGYSSSMDGYVSTDDLTLLVNRVNNLSNVNILIKEKISALIVQLENLDVLTLKKLPEDLNELYDYCLSTGIRNVNDKIIDIINLLKGANSTLEDVDDDGASKQQQPRRSSGVSDTPYSGGGYTLSPGGTDDSPQESEEEPKEEEQPEKELESETIENEKLIVASIGEFAFQTPINLFVTIGGEQIQTSSETTYGIIGFEKVDGAFYYKVIDKKTGKVYYAKFEDITIESEDEKVVHILENALVLNSTDIGSEDNFVKLADPDSYYIVKDTEEINGITFAKVIDSQTGEDYYIPVSDNVEVISLKDAAVPVSIPETDSPIVENNGDLSQDTGNTSTDIDLSSEVDINPSQETNVDLSSEVDVNPSQEIDVDSASEVDINPSQESGSDDEYGNFESTEDLDDGWEEVDE